jgi:hypothetical protein
MIQSGQAQISRELQQQYADLSDGELLQLASERSALTDEAKIALDTELRGRNLNDVDIKDHARYAKKSELRETRRRSHTLFGIRVPQKKSGIQILAALFWTAASISLILLGYLAIPARYRLPAAWQEAAGYAVFTSVFLAVWFFSYWGQSSVFWISLLISTTAHVLIVHAWTVRVGTDMLWRHRADYRGASLLGVILFFVVYGAAKLLRRKFYPVQPASGASQLT